MWIYFTCLVQFDLLEKEYMDLSKQQINLSYLAPKTLLDMLKLPCDFKWI